MPLYEIEGYNVCRKNRDLNMIRMQTGICNFLNIFQRNEAI